MDRERFEVELPMGGAAWYAAVISIPPELQERGRVDEVKRKATKGRAWRFACDLWDDVPVVKAGKTLPDLALLVSAALQIVPGFEAATVSEDQWQEARADLVDRCDTLTHWPERPDLKALHPAVLKIDQVGHYLAGNAHKFVFRDGQFAGLRGGHNQMLGGVAPSVDRDDHSVWDSFKRYVREAPEVAGRGFCLGVLQSLRPSNGTLKPGIAAAMESAKEFPGVKPWAARLKAAGLADLDQLEGELRDLRFSPN